MCSLSSFLAPKSLLQACLPLLPWAPALCWLLREGSGEGLSGHVTLRVGVFKVKKETFTPLDPDHLVQG